MLYSAPRPTTDASRRGRWSAWDGSRPGRSKVVPRAEAFLGSSIRPASRRGMAVIAPSADRNLQPSIPLSPKCDRQDEESTSATRHRARAPDALPSACRWLGSRIHFAELLRSPAAPPRRACPICRDSDRCGHGGLDCDGAVQRRSPAVAVPRSSRAPITVPQDRASE